MHIFLSFHFDIALLFKEIILSEGLVGHDVDDELRENLLKRSKFKCGNLVFDVKEKRMFACRCMDEFKLSEWCRFISDSFLVKKILAKKKEFILQGPKFNSFQLFIGGSYFCKQVVVSKACGA